MKEEKPKKGTSEKKAIASRKNGKLGGRKKGSIATHTRQSIEARKAFAAKVEKHVEELFCILMAAARAGDVKAVKEMFDRAWGRATQPISNDPDNPIVFMPFELMAKHGITSGTKSDSK